MAIIQAYFDESGKHKEHPVVTFCGVCVSQSKLDQFDDAWNSLLQQYGLRSLHMVNAMKHKKLSPTVPASTPEERIQVMKPFADCINTKLEYGLIQAYDVNGFNALPKGIRAGLGSPTDPYFVAFARGLLALNDYVHADDKISIVCDHDLETAWDCFRHYNGIRRAHDLIRKQTISLSFADDEYFPALQAADMIAYLARLEAKRQFYKTPYSYKPLLDYLVDNRPANSTLKWGVMFANETLMRSMKAKADTVKEQEERA
jgi:hypothetical protein